MNQADFFKCLSDPTRLAILALVLKQENICVCELTAQLELSQPKISRHLALLRNLSILLDQRKGQWIYYRLNPNLPQWAHAILDVLKQQSEAFKTEKSSSVSYCCE